MRKVKKKYKAVYAPVADLVTYRAMPTPELPYIDPFLFLNHHGPQHYAPGNNGLPFGPHPHRGFETLTFVLAGDVLHQDSGGGQSIIQAGGVQWMTAGSGLVHAEVSSDKFKKEGGDLEILQLWINLPAKYKMTAPAYIGLQENQIPTATEDDGKVKIHVVAGTWDNVTGPIHSLSDISIASVYMDKGGRFAVTVAAEHNIFFYVVQGVVEVNGVKAENLHLLEFENQGNKIKVEAHENSVLLFGHALPFNEPIVAQGPFVMNTEEEIKEAFQDYKQGKIGRWE